MKLIISAKYLASKLKEFDFDNDSIEQVTMHNSNLYLDGRGQSLEIWCDYLDFESPVVQTERRWDEVLELVRNIPDQPIVLNIAEKSLQVIFQY